MKKNEEVEKDKSETPEFLEIIIKDNEVEKKVVVPGKASGDFGRMREGREKTSEKWFDLITDAAYEGCILLSMALITVINVSACVVVNLSTGQVHMMGKEMAINFAVQVCSFVIAWKCRNFCFTVSCVALIAMWLFTMIRTGAWPWVNNNMEPHVVIIGHFEAVGT